MKNLIITTVIAPVVFVVVGVGYLAISRGNNAFLDNLKKTQTEASPSKFEETMSLIHQLRNTGSYDKALVLVRESLTSNIDKDGGVYREDEVVWLRYTEALLLRDIDGATNRLEAVAIWNSIAVDDKNNQRVRAFSINQMLSTYFSSFNVEIFNTIFISNNWNNVIEDLVLDDKKLAITKLAEYSNRLHSSAEALLAVNYWYMGQLTREDNAMSDELRNEYVLVIKRNLAESEMITASSTPTNDYTIIHRHGFPQAIIAIYGDNDDRDVFANKFQDTYKMVETVYEESVTKGNREISLHKLVPYSYFYHAAFLNKLYGLERSEEVSALVDKLIALVKSDTDNNFLKFAREQRNKSISDRDHNYHFFVSLSDVSPELKTILIQEGWQL